MITLLINVDDIWTVASTDALHRGRSDFAATYLTAQLWATDHSAPLYDQSLQAARFRTVSLDPGGYLPFLNPPMAAVAAAPLTGLDFASAYFVWAALQAGLLLVAVGLAVSAAPWREATPRLVPLAAGSAALASAIVLAEVALGQYDALLTLGVAAAYRGWRRDRPALAGVALGLCAGLAKPHLAVGLGAFLVGRREWRALLGAAGGVLLWAVLSIIAVPWSTLTAYPRGALAGDPSTRPDGIIGIYGPSATLLGEGAAALAVAIVAGVLIAAAALWLGRRSRSPGLLEVTLAGAVCASLLIPPHVRYYDLVLLVPLIPPLAARLAGAAERTWLRRVPALLLGWLLIGVVALAVDTPDGTIAAFTLCPLLVVAMAAAVVMARRPRTIAA